MIPNLIAEGVTQEMIDNTEAKFKLWDKIIAENYLEGTKEQQDYAYSLLNNTTIWAYAFLKVPGTDDNLKLRPYQDVILNDKHDRVLSLMSNQNGKSYALCVKALQFALLNPGKTVLMCSKTMVQGKDLLKQVKAFIQFSALDLKYDVSDTDNTTQIYFKHYDEIVDKDGKIKHKELPDSRIICVPSNESALGYKVDLGLWDEAGFVEDSEDFYYRILNPRTFASKGKIIVASNPYGQQGILWELWNGDRFHKYKFNYFDNKDNTQEDFERSSAGLSQEQIDSTLLAVFTSQEGSFLTVTERTTMQENRDNFLPLVLSEPIYIFYDFAKSKDRTVRTIGIPVKKDQDYGIYVYEMKEYPTQTPYSDIVEELEELIKLYGAEKIALVGWDNQGVGAGIEDFIKRIELFGVSCTPVNFSLQRKSALYTTFKFLAEANVKGKLGIKIPKIKECDNQLATLRFKRAARDNLIVHHDKESSRDDYPDSISGLCGLIINPDSPPITLSIVENEKRGKMIKSESDRCECGNLISPWDEKCSFCDKDLSQSL